MIWKEILVIGCKLDCRMGPDYIKNEKFRISLISDNDLVRK